MAVHKYLKLQFQELQHPLLTFVGTAHMWYTYTAGKTLVHIKVNHFLVLFLLFVVVFKKGFLGLEKWLSG